MRARWTALTRCFEDGRLGLDNNPAERALRGVAHRPQKLSLCRLRCRRSARRRDVLTDRDGKAQQHQSAGLSRRCPGPDRRPPGQTRRRPFALELAARQSHSHRGLSRRALTSTSAIASPLAPLRRSSATCLLRPLTLESKHQSTVCSPGRGRLINRQPPTGDQVSSLS